MYLVFEYLEHDLFDFLKLETKVRRSVVAQVRNSSLSDSALDRNLRDCEIFEVGFIFMLISDGLLFPLCV